MYGKDQHQYRWVVLAMASAVNSLTWGMTYAVGVLYSDWVRHFDSPHGYISFVGGLPTAMSCLAGPVFGLMVDKFGCRTSGFLGGLIITVGMVAASFANSVTQLLLGFGLVTGFGAGLAIFAASSGINEYFLHDRALAEGVVGGGLGIGMFAFSGFLELLRNQYTWRGALMIAGAVCFNNSFISLFFIRAKHILQHPLNFWRNDPSSEFEMKNIQLNDKNSQQDLDEDLDEDVDEDLDEDVDEDVESLDKEKEAEAAFSPKRPGFFRRSWHLWKNPIFLLLIAVEFPAWLATFVPYVHLIERARQSGVEPNVAYWLSSTTGLAGLVGRPFTGYVCSRFEFHPFNFYAAMQMVLGVSTVLSPFWNDINGFFVLAAIVGFLSNTYGLIKASAAFMLGRDRFTDALSWLMFVEGIGVCVGPVLAGVIFEATDSYDWSFRFSGSLLILASLLCCLKQPVERLGRKLDAKT